MPRELAVTKSYQQLPLAEKRALDLARVREPAVTCRGCGVQVMPADLLAHQRQRCDRQVGTAAKWIKSAEALALGATYMQLSRWSRPNHEGRVRVRRRGLRGDYEYLHRDLVQELANSSSVVVGTNQNVSEEP